MKFAAAITNTAVVSRMPDRYNQYLSDFTLPVEAKMRPRNLYDHTKYTWGRSMPREYGVKNDRKLKNLSRSLFMESVKISGSGTQLLPSVEKEAHRQFIVRPDGKLVRFDVS